MWGLLFIVITILVVLISYFKVQPFLSFLFVAVITGVCFDEFQYTQRWSCERRIVRGNHHFAKVHSDQRKIVSWKPDQRMHCPPDFCESFDAQRTLRFATGVRVKSSQGDVLQVIHCERALNRVGRWRCLQHHKDC